MTAIGVQLKKDTLNEENARFAQAPLSEPVFLNSVPKCGSHLLRNIVRMFVPVDQQYDIQFVQHQMLQRHLAAFADPRTYLSWGHLIMTDKTAVAVGRVRHVLLVRDPYDWVMARARFFLSDEFKGYDLLKEGTLTVDLLLNMMIFGIAEKAAPLATTFVYNAVAWLGSGVHLVRYEDILAALKDLDSDESETYFRGLLDACGIALPDDWRERVLIGSDRKQSGTARENLTGVEVEFPKVLPDPQKAMVDMVAPGLRQILGYE
jgi:hypothetical protein